MISVELEYTLSEGSPLQSLSVRKVDWSWGLLGRHDGCGKDGEVEVDEVELSTR